MKRKTDYDSLMEVCEANSRQSEQWIDNFIMYYAASRDGLEREMNQRFKRYSHITQKLHPPIVDKMKAQYIVHKIFRNQGMIEKLINHVGVKAQGADALSFYEKQRKHPWRFAFTEMIDMPHPKFHLHGDVFSDDEYLIYSPGMSTTFNDYREDVSIWLNLIAFNGSCWQTYGPIIAFRDLSADDVFFFAGELDEAVEDDEDVLQLIMDNPLPFMMLANGANSPAVIHKGYELAFHSATVDCEGFDETNITTGVEIDKVEDILRLSIGEWSEPMHYAYAYIHKIDHDCFCSSLTSAGFNALRGVLRQNGIFVDAPDVIVSLTALLNMEEVLRRKIETNPYGEFFNDREPTQRKLEELEKVNIALKLAVEDLSAGRPLDYSKYAQACALDIDTVKLIVDPGVARIDQLKDRFGR